MFPPRPHLHHPWKTTARAFPMSLREEVEPVVCISQTTNRDGSITSIAFKAAIVSLTRGNTEQETSETDGEVASL